MTNEIAKNFDIETGEILLNERVVNETEEYKIVQLEDGTFKKNMKYKNIFTRQAETEEEKIELFKVFNDNDSNLVTPLSNLVGKQISIAHFFTQPYQAFDEKTGVINEGVTTTIQDTEGAYYVTSSKSVYYSVLNIMQSFGFPNSENYKPVLVEVTGTKRQNGIQIDLKLIGYK